MTQSPNFQEIAADLRRLQQTSPTARQAIEGWDLECVRFTQQLSSKHPKLELPEQIWHYLHDADTRIQDPDYRAAQDEMLNKIIASLEQGILPASTGKTITLDPRWIAVIALALLVSIVFWVAR